MILERRLKAQEKAEASLRQKAAPPEEHGEKQSKQPGGFFETLKGLFR